MKTTYRGKNLEDCSREELVAFIEWLREALETERLNHKEDLEMERTFSEMWKALNSK